MVEVENQDHCDFTGLRTMLISHMQDLQEVTHDLHYENYRASRLGDDNTPDQPQLTNPTGRVKEGGNDAERDRVLQEKEAELQKMQQMIEHMQAQLMLQQKASAKQDKDAKTHKV